MAAAQAPVITPAGDPSVNPDTIYRLAVNPADHPEEPSVLLLDDGVVRLERDGTGSRTYRYVGQVLTQEAVDRSRFGRKTSTYSIDGSVLRVRREYVGGRGIAPQDALPELIEWLQAMARDDVRYIVLRPTR